MVDIYIIGTGIYSSLHMTREAIQAASACRKLFVLHEDPAVLRDLAALCPEVIDLYEFYRDEAPERKRADVYRRISDAVIGETMDKRGPIGLAVHGNPMFLVSAVENIVADAKKRGLQTKQIAGVSSFDTIQCDLEVDLGYGVQVLDCTTMVDQQLRIEPKMPALIFQLATFRNPKIVRSEVSNASLSELVDYLSAFYVREKECAIVLSATSVLERGQVIPLRLSQLSTSNAFSLQRRPTLYIPGEAA